MILVERTIGEWVSADIAEASDRMQSPAYSVGGNGRRYYTVLGMSNDVAVMEIYTPAVMGKIDSHRFFVTRDWRHFYDGKSGVDFHVRIV